jgi:hypothetical protein
MQDHCTPLRLTIELVPKTSWCSNMRCAIPRAAWDRLRKQVYADYDFKCGVCGASGPLSCHEQWDYDDKAHIQRLAGFIALCALCHHVKHIGLAGILAVQGSLDYDVVVEHFMAVNRCDLATFKAYKAGAFAQWRERSAHEWMVDLGPYAAMVTEKAKGESR